MFGIQVAYRSFPDIPSGS